MAEMRAKMKVKSVLVSEYGEQLCFEAVCSNEVFGSEGKSENNTYARFTPSADLTMQVNNPDLFGKFKPGQEFYLDFSLA